MTNKLQFNEFYIGESVHNRETNENGKIIGFRDTTGIPQYEVLVCSALGRSLVRWPETVLETLPSVNWIAVISEEWRRSPMRSI